MLKEPNFFRDLLFALALIGLIRIVYQQRAQTLTKQVIMPQKTNIDISTPTLLEQTKTSLDHAFNIAQQRNDPPLQQKILQVKKQWNTIKNNYQQTADQESALTVFLGPIYTVSKIAKERLVKKKLANLEAQLTLLMREVRIQSEKTSSQMKAGLV